MLGASNNLRRCAHCFVGMSRVGARRSVRTHSSRQAMAACSVVAALAILPNASFLKPPMKFLSSPIKLQTSVDNPEPSEISSPIMRDSPWTIAVEYPREDPQVWSDAIAPEEVGVSLNLVKNIVGQGILTLPAGAALLGSSLGDHHQAMIQATLLCCVFGGLSGYAFYLVGAACARTGEPSYQAVWERAMGAGTFSWLPTAASIAMTSCGCVASLIAISSSAGDLLAGALGVPGSMVDHSLLLWALSLLVLLPLSIRDLGELTFASLAGVLGTCFTAAFIIERGLDGTYSTGGFFASPATSVESLQSMPDTQATLQHTAFLVALFSNAFSAHYNAPPFLRESAAAINVRTGSSQSIMAFQRVCSMAFVISILLCLGVMLAGYQTFGENTRAFVLDNYSTYDQWASAARVGVLLCVMTEFPLLFLRLRDDLLGLLGVDTTPENDTRADDMELSRPKTLGACVLLTMLVMIANAAPSLGAVNAISGALGGGFLCYAAPGLISLRLAGGWSGARPPAATFETMISGILVISGTAAAVLGCWVSLG